MSLKLFKAPKDPGNYIDISLWKKKRIMKYIWPRPQLPTKLLDKPNGAWEVCLLQRRSGEGILDYSPGNES